MNDQPIGSKPAQVSPPSGGRRIVTLRSVLLGLIGVIGMCGFAPYNDLVVKNSVLVGSFFPLAPLAVLIILLAFNSILHRLRSRFVLRSPELAVVLVMMLVASAVPGFGLMRLLPGALSAFQRLPSVDTRVATLMRGMEMPHWMLPTLSDPSADPTKQATDIVVSGFIQRVPEDQARPATWIAIARAWAPPLLGWGVFFAFLFGAILCAAVILRAQWAEDERLPFPLAEVYVALLEPPEAGRSWNTLLSSWSLWIPAAAVFFVHLTGGLSLYTHGVVPAIPLQYNISGLFADPPLSAMAVAMKSTKIFFSVIGLCYFLQTSVSFSLWMATILFSLQAIGTTAMGAEYQPRMGYYQSLGAMLVLAALTLWTGRYRWLEVLRAMFGRFDRTNTPHYLPPYVAGWGLTLCMAGCAAWLLMIGAGVVGTILILGFMAALYVVAARVVAETGLMNLMLAIDLGAFNQMVVGGIYGGIVGPAATRNYFWATFFNYFWVQGLREALPPFALNGLRVTDRVALDATPPRSGRLAGLGIILVMALALLVAYASSAGGMLWTEYHHISSIDQNPETPINSFATVAAPESLAKGLTEGYSAAGPKDHEKQLLIRFTTVGATVTLVLAVLRMRFAGWPLHPVVLLLAPAGPVQTIWLSLFIGWLAKTLIVRFGGSKLFQQSRPVFLGLILGEAGAAVFWLVINLCFALSGHEFMSFRPTP